VIEKTLSIIKPDATRRYLTGQINAHIEENGLHIIAQRRLKITPAQAAIFYEVHKERAFFEELCQSVSSGAIVAQVLQGNDAIVRYRTLMGATNPANAEEGTLRNKFGVSIEENSVHGSDSAETAAKEICFFFSVLDFVE
jgi:nucleoside-diphosphate kinase